MKLKKEMGIATLANWGGTFSSYLIAFFATPVIVYSFGNTRYGIWSLAMSLTAYYGLLDFGISTTIIKYYSEYIEKKDEKSANSVINAAFFLYLMIFFILLSAVFVIIWNVDNIFNIPSDLLTETKILFCITGITFGIELVGNTFRAVVLSLRKFVLRNVIQTVFSIIRTTSIIVILLSGYGLIVAGIVVLCVDLVRNIIYFIYAYRLSPFLKISFKMIDIALIKNSFAFTFYNLLRQISIRIIERTDLILVGIFFDMKIVAFYSIGESLVRYVQMIPKGLRSTILPFSSKLNASQQNKDLMKMAFFLPKYTITFFLGILLMMALFGREFIGLWMGPGYDMSFGIVIILLLSKMIFMSQSILVHLLTGMGYNKYFGILGLVEAVVKISLSILLIKLFGVYGIAFGSLFTFLITSLVLVPNYALKKVGVDRIKYYINVIIIPSLLCVLLYILNYSLGQKSIFWIPLVTVEYLLVYYLFVWKEVRIKNRKIVWRFSL